MLKEKVQFDHEHMDAYQVALDIAVLIYEIVEHLPRGRAYLTDQLQRSGRSILLQNALVFLKCVNVLSS